MVEKKGFTVTDDWYGHNSIEAEVGTSSLPEGGHDRYSQTYLRLKDTGSTQWKLKVTPSGLSPSAEFDDLEQIELILEGDSEARIMLEVFNFCRKVLRSQLRKAGWRGICRRAGVWFSDIPMRWRRYRYQRSLIAKVTRKALS